MRRRRPPSTTPACEVAARPTSQLRPLLALFVAAAVISAVATTGGGGASAAAATPTLISSASSSTIIGLEIFDNANLLGANNPTGTLTFLLFGPDDPTCVTPIFSSVVPVTSTSVNSQHFTTSQSGTYRFTVSYSGDANNNAVGPTACSDPGSAVIVQSANTVLTSTAASAGPTIHDTAVLGNGFNPTGSLTFLLAGPGDTFCSDPPVFTSTVPVNGNGTYESGPFTPSVSGTYKYRVTYSGDANNFPEGPTPCLDLLEAVTVVVGSPVTLTTDASPDVVTVGSPVSDTATLTGGSAPTGTVIFTLYGPDDATCTAPPVFTSAAQPIVPPGTATSGPFIPTAPGTYRWLASYSGDANNPSIATLCGDPAETVVVTAPQSVSLTTTASPGVVVGDLVGDRATLTGGSAPTGTITFNLYGPDDATCSGISAFTSIKTVAGPGNYDSANFTPLTPGTYRWLASYSGDANNPPVATACGDPAETVVVTAPPSLTLTTTASPGVVVGDLVGDRATLTGGSAPTGTITFNLYGPDDATCSGISAFTSIKTVAGPGNYDSASFIPTAPGTYRWLASYSGDANNPPVATACGDPAETVVVTAPPPTTPTLTTVASPDVVLGGGIQDTATLRGGDDPDGFLTFTLHGPDDPTCSSLTTIPVVVPVNGNGDYSPIGAYVPTAAGTYQWTVTYSGDARNAPVSTACGDPAESVTVTAPPPTTPTLTTTASPGVIVGGTIHDTAILSGGDNPTGFVIFELHGPDDPACATEVNIPVAVEVNGNGPYDGGSFAPTVAGTYQWTASYSGDANNAPVNTPCNDPAEQVRITSPPPSIGVDASAGAASLPEPGGTFTGRVSVTNSGAETVTLSGLADEDLNGVGTCSVPQTLAPGGTYSCTFPVVFTGNAGASRTIPVTATVVDATGASFTFTDTFVITLTDVAPTLTVAKTAEPSTLVAPGGVFTYRVTVTNTSHEPVTVVALSDDVHGNLAGSGTCAVGALLAADGATYGCSFEATFTGRAGDRQTVTVTATVADDDAGTASASASATVALSLAPTVPPVTVAPVTDVTTVPGIPALPRVGPGPPLPPVSGAVTPSAGRQVARTGSNLAAQAGWGARAAFAGGLVLLATRARRRRVTAPTQARQASNNGGWKA